MTRLQFWWSQQPDEKALRSIVSKRGGRTRKARGTAKRSPETLAKMHAARDAWIKANPDKRSKALKRGWRNRRKSKMVGACRYCGDLVKTITGAKAYCSERCRRKWLREQPEAWMAVNCAHCGKNYLTEKKCPRETCSHRCGALRWRLKKRNGCVSLPA
jgi:endogenous inhibitor of DNA gyrase (YacG/DUF329 family)